MTEYVTKSITITQEQVDYLDANHIKLSTLVRDLLDDYIEDKQDKEE